MCERDVDRTNSILKTKIENTEADESLITVRLADYTLLKTRRINISLGPITGENPRLIQRNALCFVERKAQQGSGQGLVETGLVKERVPVGGEDQPVGHVTKDGQLALLARVLGHPNRNSILNNEEIMVLLQNFHSRDSYDRYILIQSLKC